MTQDQLADEFRFWQQHPITKAISKEFENRVEALENLLLNLDSDNLENLATLYVITKARISVYNDFLNIGLEDISTEEEIEDND